MIALIEEENMLLTASKSEAYNCTIDIYMGEKPFEAIVEWLKINTKKI
jgi:hypothetical protein